MPPSNQAGRIDALDGMRGAAIMAVLIHHVCKVPELNQGLISVNSVFSFGHFGSEFFLALSGYFMTRSLMKVKLQANSATSVIVRRYLRIAPLYYLALIANVFIFPSLMSQFIEKAKPIPGWDVILLYALGLSNVSVALNGYLNFFDVTWTLNVQDQFYLFWIPAFIKLPARWQKTVCWSLIVITQILRSITAGFVSVNVIHVLMPFRMDALAIGCLFALMNTEILIRHARFIVPMTLIASVAFLIILAIFPYQGSEWFPRIGYTVLGLLSALWLWTGLTVVPPGFLGRILYHPWLRWYGQRSYAIYLFHLLVYNALLAIGWFIRHKIFHMQSNINHTYIQAVIMGILTIPACVPVAWILWKTVEEPLNRIRDRVKKPESIETSSPPSLTPASASTLK